MRSCSWAVTSRSASGGLLLLSRCFPRALTDAISLCCATGGCFPVNREAYGSYPDSQHHRADTTPTLVLSVPGGEHPLRPWIAMSLQPHFALSPRLWLSSFPAGCHWTSFAAELYLELLSQPPSVLLQAEIPGDVWGI